MLILQGILDQIWLQNFGNIGNQLKTTELRTDLLKVLQILCSGWKVIFSQHHFQLIIGCGSKAQECHKEEGEEYREAN